MWSIPARRLAAPVVLLGALVCIALGAAPSSAGHSCPTGLTANHLFGMSVCLPPPPPPSALTFVSGVDLGVGEDERGGLYVARADGSGLRKITSFTTRGFLFSRVHGVNFPDDHPALSPDGRRIAFATNRGNPGEPDRDLWIMDANGTGMEPLYASPDLDIEPSFSPDGTRIVFSRRSGGDFEIVVLTLATGATFRLTDNSEDDLEPHWSPDGERIAFTRATRANDKEIFVIDADGGGERQVTDSRKEDHDAWWEPNGQNLLITSERFPTSLPFGNVYRIRAADGREVTAGDAVDRENGDLTDDTALGAGDPTMSPDGRRIAYFKAVTPLTTGPMSLFVMNANGTGKERIPVEGLVTVHPNFGRMADSDADGTPDYEESGPVGVPTLRAGRSLRAGRTARLAVDWRHTRGAWRALERLRFRLVRDGGEVATVISWTEDDNSLALYDPRRGTFTRGARPGSRRTLTAPLVSLDLRRTRVIGLDRARVRLELALRFPARAKGRYVLEALGSDDSFTRRRGARSEDRGPIAVLTVR